MKHYKKNLELVISYYSYVALSFISYVPTEETSVFHWSRFNPIALWMAKTQWSFGCSECSRVMVYGTPSCFFFVCLFFFSYLFKQSLPMAFILLKERFCC